MNSHGSASDFNTNLLHSSNRNMPQSPENGKLPSTQQTQRFSPAKMISSKSTSRTRHPNNYSKTVRGGQAKRNQRAGPNADVAMQFRTGSGLGSS